MLPRFSDFIDFLVFETSQVSGFSGIPDLIDILCLLFFGVADLPRSQNIVFMIFILVFSMSPLFHISDLLDLGFSVFKFQFPASNFQLEFSTGETSMCSNKRVSKRENKVV